MPMLSSRIIHVSLTILGWTGIACFALTILMTGITLSPYGQRLVRDYGATTRMP